MTYCYDFKSKYKMSQKLQKKQDDESVSKKVKLIKDLIRSREIENARLKRLVEQGENDEIIQLKTEIERLKEVCNCFSMIF